MLVFGLKGAGQPPRPIPIGRLFEGRGRATENPATISHSTIASEQMMVHRLHQNPQVSHRRSCQDKMRLLFRSELRQQPHRGNG